MHKHCQELGVETEFLSREQAKILEPDVRAVVSVLHSPSTGIIDSHSLMTYLLGRLEEQDGNIAYGSLVKSIEPLTKGSEGYKLTTISQDSKEEFEITSRYVINAAGLHACSVFNMLLPKDRQMTPFYAKGSYFSYSHSTPKPKRLIYPCPNKNLAG